ncbi:MAG: glycosyltransferase family A protein [Candidatus Rokuibacteriota bacterium]
MARLADYRRPRTRVIRSANRGLPAARNLGIRSTSGPYVCALDADDLLEPTMLERSVEALEREPSLAFVSHWLRTFGDETAEWTPNDCAFPALLERNTVNGAALVRRSALEAVGGFDESMRQGCEDWDLWIGLVERGLPGTILPEFLFRYRRRAGSMSRLMADGGTDLAVFEYIVRKHAESYRRHLDVLVRRRAVLVGDLLAHRYALALEESEWLGPALATKRADLAMLRARHARAGLDELRITRQALGDARWEIQALRDSWSWRLTAPLRRVYGWLRPPAGQA